MIKELHWFYAVQLLDHDEGGADAAARVGVPAGRRQEVR
jgi:hypothetical protein